MRQVILVGVTDEDSRQSTQNGWNDPDPQLSRPWPYGQLRNGGPPRRPFSAVRYWLPGTILAIATGTVSLLLAALSGEFGWAIFGIPVTMGAFFGYGLPFKHALWTSLLGAVAFISSTLLAATAGPAGIFCAVILAAIGAPFALIGVACGWGLRTRMRDSRYYWSRFLPLILAAVLGGPVAALEAHLTPPNSIAAVSTAAVVEASPTDIWSARIFGDDETAEAPALRRIGLAAPERNTGHASLVGDVKEIPLSDGLVRLRITRSDAPRVLEYDVLEQSGFEDGTARLSGGALQLDALPDGATRVTITTRYEPLLGARAIWGPIERFVAEQLHRHVLRETRRAVELRGTPPATQSDALDQ